MKKILLCLLICSSIHSWAQIDFGAACTIIQKLDEKIYKMDYKALSIKDRIDRNKAIKAEIDSLENIDANERLEDSLSIRVEGLRILEVVRGNLFDILEIGKKDFDINQLENKLACIVRTETITWLEFALSLKIKEIETYIERWKLGKIKEPIQYKHANESLKTYKDIFDIVRKRVDEIMPSEMAFYKFTETSNQFLKYIRIEHNNDFLAMYNDDRDFTGGFRFEFATDHLKMRLFSSFTDRVRNPNSRSWYSYQSIFLGGEGYTPYIRDTCIFNTPTSIDTLDRPYASIVYIGRAKYRIFRKGDIRILSQIRVGWVGIEAADKVQALIHRDITTTSVRPQGWESQIANGKRLALNIDLYPEFMLISKGKTILNHKGSQQELFMNNDNKKWFNRVPEFINISTLAEIKAGHDMTALGVGIAFSTRNFKQQGGVSMPFYNENVHSNRRRKSNVWNCIELDTKVQYRYVIHNTMLEGYGIFSSLEESYDVDPLNDFYKIDGSNINRNVFIWDTNLSLRFKYVGIYYRLNIMSPEFDLPVNDHIYPECASFIRSNKISTIHNKSPWNHVGTIGFVFKIK